MARNLMKPISHETRRSISLVLWIIAMGIGGFTMALAWVASGKVAADGANVAISALTTLVLCMTAWNITKPARVRVVPEKGKTDELAADTAAVSPVIAVILMVAITVVLATTVFVLVNSISEQQGEIPPSIAWRAEGGNVTVISGPTGLDWSDFEVVGCSTMPTGSLDAGDAVSGCSGHVTIRHKPSNSLSYEGDVS